MTTRTLRPPTPVWIRVLAGVAVTALAIPLITLAWRLPYDRVGDLLGEPALRDALWRSLAASLAGATVATLLGVPLAIVLARAEGWRHRAMRATVLIPMVLPPVVIGVVLLLAYGRTGTIGGPVERALGFSAPFTFAGVILTAAFVGLPFVVMTMEAALRSIDHSQVEVARTLGLSATSRLVRIELPLARGGLAAGVLLAWARALGEFGATITFAGNLPGRTQTLPLAIFLQLEQDPQVAYLLSGVMVLLAVLVLVALRSRWTEGLR